MEKNETFPLEQWWLRLFSQKWNEREIRENLSTYGSLRTFLLSRYQFPIVFSLQSAWFFQYFYRFVSSWMSSEIVSEIKNQIKYFNQPLKKLPPSSAHNRLSLKSRLAFNLIFLFYHYTMYFHSQSSSSSLLDNAKSPRGNLFFVHCLFTLTQCSVLSSQQFPLRVSISEQIFFCVFSCFVTDAAAFASVRSLWVCRCCEICVWDRLRIENQQTVKIPSLSFAAVHHHRGEMTTQRITMLCSFRKSNDDENDSLNSNEWSWISKRKFYRVCVFCFLYYNNHLLYRCLSTRKNRCCRSFYVFFPRSQVSPNPPATVQSTTQLEIG